MTALVGVLVLLMANGAVVMQPLPQLPGAVCVAQFGDAVAQCYRPTKKIAGTQGYEAQRFTIALKVSP